MIKIDGHKFYDQKIGHYQFDQATLDPMWPILRGRIVTKPNGRSSNSAQSNQSYIWAKPNIRILFFSFFLEILVNKMGQAQQFSLFIFISCQF
jgi:hypothetical protein